MIKRPLTEGYVKKGGVNKPPTTAKPQVKPPPQKQKPKK